MPRFPLSFPFAGRADGSAKADQAPFTTKSARNVRGRDPSSGRVRGAQRSGLIKFNPSAIGASRIKALISTAVDDRKLAYTFSSGAVSKDWSAILPSKGDCLNAKTDRQGNVYALDGNAGIAKYNSAGTLVLKIALPVADPSHVVRALWIDDADRIFAGVSAGGDACRSGIQAFPAPCQIRCG